MARKPISEEDLALWKRVTADAEPLKGRRMPVNPVALPEDKPHRKKETKPATRKTTILKAEAAPALVHSARQPHVHDSPMDLDAHPRGSIPGLDRRMQQRLRRGQMPIEAEIDLHGMTQAEAHRALVHFINVQHAAGRRCVLVITGKGAVTGKRGEREPGVLRRMTPRWLSEAGVKEKILGTAPARPNQGGSGALYVLLKRRK